MNLDILFIGRQLRVLRAMERSPRYAQVDFIIKESGVPMASCYRVLAELEELGYVAKTNPDAPLIDAGGAGMRSRSSWRLTESGAAVITPLAEWDRQSWHRRLFGPPAPTTISP